MTLTFLRLSDPNLGEQSWIYRGDVFQRTEDCFLTQVIHDFPFGADGKGENVLDLVFTSDPERLLELRHEPPLCHPSKGHAVFTWSFGFGSLADKNNVRD